VEGGTGIELLTEEPLPKLDLIALDTLGPPQRSPIDEMNPVIK